MTGTRFLASILATATIACSTGGIATMNDGGAGGIDAALPACPASTMDPDGGLPVGDAGFAMISPGFDGGPTGAGASLSVPGGLPDASNFFAVLYPVQPALPPAVPVRPMSPLYQLNTTLPADVLVTIPLAPAYAGCSAALYENTANISGYPPTPAGTWHRLTGDLSMRSVSARVPALPDPNGTTQSTLLLAGTCATECAGDCVDLTNDNANCGGCGQACAAPTFCVRGACGGQVLATMSSPGRPLIAVDGDMVYFVSPSISASKLGSIEAVPKAGGPTMVVVANPGGMVLALRALAGTLYWSYVPPSNGTYLASQPVDGGAPFTIGGGPFQGISGPFAVDGTRVYFAVTGPMGPGPAGPSGVISLPVNAADTTGEMMLASTSGQVPAIDTDGSHLAWIDNQTAKVLDLTTPGASPVALGSVGTGYSSFGLPVLVVDGDAVVMLGGGVKPMNGGPPSGFTLLRVPIDGSAPEELAQPSEPLDVAARAGTVAWTDQYGTGAVWAKRPGQSPVLLLSGGVAGSVALDDQAVYDMTSSTLWRLAVPP